MSAYRLSCIGNAEWGPRTSNRSRSLFNSEAVERDKWTQFFFNLPKAPLELQLAKARADRELELVRSKQKAALERTESSPRSKCRPLTALHNSPRTTNRVKVVMETRMRPAIVKESKSEYNLCPSCGLVKDSLLNHQHAEQRLKKLLAQHPSLLPKRQHRRSSNVLRML
ncbi:uncharacterized protein LOC6611199 [Drosophila sechellia]|uniref:Uncharacterized protein n=3 Tax=melanogaster subgroup TaxID=32351 RepID=A0A0J9R227_DROSI|nr:uncharacterized protein LOC6611199 [Drosophila sechellia]XP_016024929.1 uncharacterized protein LOC27206504 [Drosophila simulans]EDW51678.1 GM15116 [Drosophila sechellia]KMY90161.1 uncharacterized protein Dsimw501_GD22042 [Drosophila simulans]